MPLYTYKCPACNKDQIEKRTFEEVYDEVTCEFCGEKYDGQINKLIDKNIKATYAQGRGKGNWGKK